ncbi:Heptaprenyl diphosphate synthase component 2 [compost metagenome]
MAFQIRDDLLDLSGTEKQIGKPPGSDMRQGNITLPVIYSLEDSRLRTPLLEELALIRSGQAGVGRAIDLILSGDGITRAEELASRYIDKALAALEQLPVNKTRRNLRDIAYFVTGRAY